MTKLKLPQNQQFCFCHDGVSLQMVSGGAAKEGYLGRVTLKIDGEYVDYVKAQQSNEQVEPVGALLLGGVFQTSEGFEFEEWDIEWNHKAVEALQEKLVTNEPVTLSLYTHPPVPTAQPKQESQKGGCTWCGGNCPQFECDTHSTWMNEPLVRRDLPPHPKEPEQEPVAKVVSTAPERIWLDLGFEPSDEDEISFNDLVDATWSHDNATGYGIEYVRANIAAHGIKE